MKAKILVVDDNQDVIFSIIDSLGMIEPEFEIIGVNSGAECMEKIEQIMPDMILMDIMMPEMDGFETVAQIKQIDSVKNIPLIFLTGKTDNISRNLGLLTSEDYIQKPYDTVDLRDRIRKVLESKSN